jgi:hypothetical protein
LSGGGFALAYRAVDSDGQRRVGLCRLNDQLSLVARTAVPFSDLVRPGDGRQLAPQAERWFADPRLAWWQERLYVYWNSGIHRPANHQFIQEVDTHSLQPTGPCFTLECAEGRQPIEKNWSLFEYQGALHAFYTLSPAVVLRVTDITPSAFIFSKIASTKWDAVSYTSRYGDLRGGAPPLQIANQLYVFFHSAARPVLRHRYVAGLLVTAAAPPFQPLSWTPLPVPLPNPFGRLPLPNPFRRKAPLNGTVAEVIYPAGISSDEGSLLVSYGINDQHAAIARLDFGMLEERLLPVQLGADRRSRIADLRAFRGRAAGGVLKLAAAAFKHRP